MTQRPFEIKAMHLARKAAIYVRQSSDAQVVHHRGSTDTSAASDAMPSPGAGRTTKSR